MLNLEYQAPLPLQRNTEQKPPTVPYTMGKFCFPSFNRRKSCPGGSMPNKVLVRLKHTFSFSVAEVYTAQVFATVSLLKSGRGGALPPLSLLPRDLPPHGGGWRDLPPPVRCQNLRPRRYFQAISNVRPVHTTLGEPLPPSRGQTPPHP